MQKLDTIMIIERAKCKLYHTQMSKDAPLDEKFIDALNEAYT